MGFSEKDKLEVKRKSNFRCCIYENIKPLEIHHIIPENGKDTDVINNAVPLCADCHDTYGENKIKQKWIREKRDHWYNLCSRYYLAFRESFPSSELGETSEPKFEGEITNQEISIYHHIFNDEGFEKSAKIIFNLVRLAQKEHPTKKGQNRE